MNLAGSMIPRTFTVSSILPSKAYEPNFSAKEGLVWGSLKVKS